MSIVIGGAWPYANGSLHLGHIAALLPGDILARYYRLKKENVLYVSGSDCNGTPISIRANQEGVTVKEIADRYHEEFTACFNKLGFTYDLYTRTDAEHHHQTVKNIFLELLDNGFLYKITIEQTYCEHDKQFLPDRFVEGICPICGSKARGDQCDHCSTILDPLDLIDRRCKICGNHPTVKETEHFYFALSKMQNALEHYVQNAKEQKAWRQNAIDLSERYLAEGVPDRAVTRDLPNGIEVPVDGFDGKKIYVWIEAVSGYYTATLEWAQQHQKNVQDFWNSDTISYYVHGKDNIPFHTIIWPSILMGLNSPALPTHIVSNEYLTLEKRKLSTSLNWAVWVPYIIERYDADTIRYFLTINAPENRDTDFSWREFIYSHNSELLGAYGNFVNRTLKFIEKSFDKQIPKGILNTSIKLQTQKLYDEVAIAIEQGHFKAPLEEIFSYIRSANKYFDEQQPWLQVKDDEVGCANTLATCVYIIANLSQLLEPFIPFSTKKIRDMLGITNVSWHELVELPTSIQYVEPLFERLDIALIDEEYQHLISQSNAVK
ncbi:methionine--tRNA ligase [Viridibacillus arvi]|uniref:Methionine--tRNA ligase n=1 Tax=Viridibacillus arvi TaxID=263475 RepID=A0A0M0LLN2_9BACL|nr:methionine--tRNA ligase [Viridibacillus arvi]KOO51965.1 methionyl-tRNA synthetase [Viridibacillus arvi]